MHIYSPEQWVFLFYIYCFFGWCFESVYVSLLQRHWVNRGFLRAPLLPIYGSGALCILLVCLPVRDNPFAVFVLGVIFPTLLEYATGYVMELLFHMRYWDYTGKKGNINGYICLQSSIAWGFLSRLLTAQGHPEPTGTAKLTPAYNLPCRYVLHTVGPIVRGALTERDEEALASCYRACLELARENGLRSVAFCCVSTGEFHFPNRRAAEIAVQTVRAHRGEIEVIFNVFKDLDREIYRTLLG